MQAFIPVPGKGDVGHVHRVQVKAELQAGAEGDGEGPLALFAAAAQLLGAPCLRGALAGPRLVADVADLIGPAMQHPSRAPHMADFRVPHLGHIDMLVMRL